MCSTIATSVSNLIVNLSCPTIVQKLPNACMGTHKMQVVHNYKVFPLTKTPNCMVTGMQPKVVEGNLGQDNLGEDNLGEVAGEGNLGEDNLGEGNLGQGNLGVGSLAEAGEDRQTSHREVVEPA